MLQNECGGHRVQRIPPTERKGRVHTSTVTVAVIDATVKRVELRESDLEISWYSGTGAGGQHRNKHQNSCRILHKPTGIVATAQCRSRVNSEQEARAAVEARVVGRCSAKHYEVLSKERKDQVGSGMRGDKMRTYRFQDDTVTDHNSGKRANLTSVMKGNFNLLW